MIKIMCYVLLYNRCCPLLTSLHVYYFNILNPNENSDYAECIWSYSIYFGTKWI